MCASHVYGHQMPSLRSQSSPPTTQISGSDFRLASFSEETPLPTKLSSWTEYVHLCRLSSLTQQSV